MSNDVAAAARNARLGMASGVLRNARRNLRGSASGTPGLALLTCSAFLAPRKSEENAKFFSADYSKR